MDQSLVNMKQFRKELMKDFVSAMKESIQYFLMETLVNLPKKYRRFSKKISVIVSEATFRGIAEGIPGGISKGIATGFSTGIHKGTTEEIYSFKVNLKDIFAGIFI